MRRFRTWLLERFLPAWAKDSIFQENQVLCRELEKKEQEIRELNAYINGLETSLRAVRRIVIRMGGGAA